MGKSSTKTRSVTHVVKSTADHDPQKVLDEVAAKLAPGEVAKIPSYAKKRLEHLKVLIAAAATDGALLLKVPLADGALQPWELAVLPVAAKLAREHGDAVGADSLAADTTLSAKDAALLATVREDQKLLLSAFRRLRFKGRSAELKRLRAIEAGDPGDVVDAHDDSSALIALANHDDHRTWVASLPLGEASAVTRLEAAQARLETLAKAVLDDKAAARRRDTLRRVWTVTQRIERRVREAGDYLFHGTAKRAAYAAYKPPVTRKKKAK